MLLADSKRKPFKVRGRSKFLVCDHTKPGMRLDDLHPELVDLIFATSNFSQTAFTKLIPIDGDSQYNILREQLVPAFAYVNDLLALRLVNASLSRRFKSVACFHAHERAVRLYISEMRAAGNRDRARDKWNICSIASGVCTQHAAFDNELAGAVALQNLKSYRHMQAIWDGTAKDNGQHLTGLLNEVNEHRKTRRLVPQRMSQLVQPVNP